MKSTRTLKPKQIIQPSFILPLRVIEKNETCTFPEKIRNTSLKSTGEMRCDPFFCPVCVCLCICIVSVWFEGGCGAVSFAAVSVLMEREGACRILCVSSLHVRDIAWRKCITGRCPKNPSAPLHSPFPFLVYLPLLSLSTGNTEAL